MITMHVGDEKVCILRAKLCLLCAAEYLLEMHVLPLIDDVKDFVKKVEERAVGAEVMTSLTPGQAVIKIVNEEMIAMMGSEGAELKLLPRNEVTIYMMEGLQGSGKTTTSAKIGRAHV